LGHEAKWGCCAPCQQFALPDDDRPDRHLSGVTGAYRLIKGNVHPFFIDLRIGFHCQPLS